MSVVNKMLQDLEERKSDTDTIDSDYHAPQKKRSLLWILLLIFIVVIVFGLLNYFPLTQKNDISNQVGEKTEPTQVLPKVTKKMSVVPDENASSQSKVETEEKLSPKLVDVKDVDSSDFKSPDLVLEQTINQNQSVGVTEIHPEPKSVVKITPTKPVSQSNLESQDRQVPQQVSSFSMTDSNDKNIAKSLEQRISISLENDNHVLASSLLQQLLDAEPENLKARKKLASLLFAQGQYAGAKLLLEQGIELHPLQGDLKLMLARLLMLQKEPNQALLALTNFEPSKDKQSEYLAYRASLAQQLSNTELARSDYQRLTTIEASNAKWWLGLAVAEDQLGNVDLALKAYKNANSLGQLLGSVDDFIQQRISVLAGAQ